jgi:hypothetical protein
MTRTETELLSTLLVIYLHDCVYWLGPNDEAFTRSSSANWNTHISGAHSFTLLHKKPILVDPFLLLPGFIRVKTANAIHPTDRILRKVSKRLNRLWLIEAQSRVQALLILIFFPWIVWTGRLAMLWQNFLIALLINHAAFLISLSFVLRRNRLPGSANILLQVAANPLGAVRVLEVLSQRLFDQFSSRHSGAASDTDT